jgi:hypothetical protein
MRWGDKKIDLAAAPLVQPVFCDPIGSRNPPATWQVLNTYFKNKKTQICMKQIKWTIMSLAIIFSVCGAFVTRPHYDCTYDIQYYWNGYGYAPAGTFGVNYICEDGPQNCTYTKFGLNYYACQTGTYIFLDISKQK